MRFGLSPTQSQPLFDVMCLQAGLAEALGFDVLWAHEHHSGGTTYPSPLMTLAALAGVTRRIELGTNMLLLPLHHPLRVAEDAAMVDVMSGGRLRLGVSAGYSPADLQAFGVSPDARAKRMREGLSLIRAVWLGAPVSLDSELCQLRNFTLHPKPIRQPAPPIYMGGRRRRNPASCAPWRRTDHQCNAKDQRCPAHACRLCGGAARDRPAT